MDKLKNAMSRLGIGECPICKNKLSFISNEICNGILEFNGMPSYTNLMKEKHYVFCKNCGYINEAIMIGLKIIPTDRILENDINWDKKYIEDNVLIWGTEGINPFNIEDKD